MNSKSSSEKLTFKKWFFSLSPTNPQNGEFREIHKFPEDGKDYVIVFTCELILGGGYICTPIKVEGLKVF